MKSRRLLFGALLLAAMLASRGRAEPWTLTLRVENDMPANSDRYYSNGLSATFAQCIPEDKFRWPGLLPAVGLDNPGRLSRGFTVGQVMVTPTDIRLLVPDPRDRPYSGLLFAGIVWQRFGERHLTAFKLITGMVGPASLAEQTQRAWHRAIDVELPRGWEYQLRNEPILNLVWERRWRICQRGEAGGWGGDALLIGGGMLGNVLTQAYAQLQVRAGWRVPHDYGTSLIRGIGATPPARDLAPWGLHGFAGIGGLGVARNLTLDGNTFRDSPSVSKFPWVPAAEAGLVWRARAWQVTASWVAWGREFAGQMRHSEFGTLAISIIH
ncbi:MAG: lipid A deacylase LpxR family protein [Opitutaceae bacterium]|nr:lipid A deacylase LpxR family protein [Opitutaceae bacterium]